MSLYNMLFGVNENAPVLLGMLGLNMEYFDRFRDVDLIKNGTVIRVFVRLGGGNRKSYKETWKKIKSNPLYIKDYDDKFDKTYAYIEFDIPEDYKKTALKMYKSEPVSFEDKFNQCLKNMDDPNSEAAKKAEIIGNKIMNGMENGESFIVF